VAEQLLLNFPGAGFGGATSYRRFSDQDTSCSLSKFKQAAENPEIFFFLGLKTNYVRKITKRENFAVHPYKFPSLKKCFPKS